MSEIIILGAGAIGRGYLPWVFSQAKSDGLKGSEEYKYIFVDSNPNIISQMRKSRKFDTYRVKNKTLEKRTVPVHEAYLPHEFKTDSFRKVSAVFMNVGPRNVVSAAKLVESLQCPVILSENDPATVDLVKSSTQLKQVYFAVPDVITSNSAPRHLLDIDPLSVVTEDGTMFIDSRVGGLPGDYHACTESELMQQWTAKLYLHNTPHCVAAYLGALAGVTYVHEAMAIPEINTIVTGSMQEMLNSLKLKWDIPHPFLDWYAEKELARFSNELLFDPISRVAREPLRKLESEGRLLGAAQICLSLGFVPENILFGIGSALLFEEPTDADHHLVFMRKALSSPSLLTHVLGLRKGEALERVLSIRLGQILQKLETLIPHRGTNLSKPSPSDEKNGKWQKEFELALRSVSTCGEIALNRPERLNVTTKESARDVVTEMDKQIENRIIAILSESKHPILAEESFKTEQVDHLNRAETFWLVDSIDGTANYISGLPNYAVSVGLLHQWKFTAGAVSLPAFKELYFTYGNETISSYLNGKQLRISDSPLSQSLIGVSFSGSTGDPEFRKHQYDLFGKVNDLSRGCLRLGSAASNLCAVASGKLQAVYGFSAQLWDVGGGLAVARYAGAKIFWKRIPNSSRCHYIAGAPTAANQLREILEAQDWMEL